MVKLTPFKFDPFDLREIPVHAGGMVYPVVPHKLNFSKNYYVRAFVEMYEALGMANSERSFDVSMDQFKNGWAFFVIPLNSTLDDSCGFELLRSGTTSIRATFDSPIPKGGLVQQPHQQPDADAELQAQIEDAEEDLLLNWWREDPTIIRFPFGNRRAPAIEAALLQRAKHEAEIFRQYA
ncbi:hypothetical protein niasHT_002352 [Heterodera trifolii]|uniref:Uncharacterized protein n=1 Tax=Heterodera trifolii TaxID=157864 RepID=A0ABD2LM85_9BILA